MNNLNDIFFAPAANQELTYDQVLEDVQRYFAENHASTIAEAGEANAERATALLKELMVQYIVKRKYAISGLTTEQVTSAVNAAVTGAMAEGTDYTDVSHYIEYENKGGTWTPDEHWYDDLVEHTFEY